MRIPRDEALGIHAQDDSFLDRAPWPFETTPPSAYPLLLHFHPLVIYRHQVLKQSDVVLAQVLLSSQFTAAEKKRNFDYYDPLTTGDSSLSPCIQSVAAAELGLRGRRLPLLHADRPDGPGRRQRQRRARLPRGRDGRLVGVAGVRLRGAPGRRRVDLPFAPHLPAAWSRLAFRLLVGGSTLAVAITRHEVRYEVTGGDGAVDPPLRAARAGRRRSSPVTIGLDPTLRAVIFDLDGVHHRHRRAPLPRLEAAGRRGVDPVRPGAERAAQGREPDGEPATSSSTARARPPACPTGSGSPTARTPTSGS